MRALALASLLATCGSFSVSGCHSRPRAGTSAANSASASGAPGASALAFVAPSASPAAPESPSPPSPVQLPEGPVLAIDAGHGVGPIRLGATVPTIERLMAAPCEVKTAEVCRYIVRAVEFDLKNGVTERIVVHRHERPAGADARGQEQVYGFFNGGIPPGVGLGMLESAVFEILGKPERVDAVFGANAFGTVERVSYPGMLLEFDTYKNGKVMLGGVIIGRASNPG